MASPGKTLRRAALIFGGKIPTREEREAVDKDNKGEEAGKGDSRQMTE